MYKCPELLRNSTISKENTNHKPAKTEERVWVGNYEEKGKRVKSPSGKARVWPWRCRVHPEFGGSVTPWAHAGPWTREQATGCERSMPGALETTVDGGRFWILPISSVLSIFRSQNLSSKIPISWRHLVWVRSWVSHRIARTERPRQVRAGGGLPEDGPAATRRPHTENKAGRGLHSFHKNASTGEPTSGMRCSETWGGNVWKWDP